MGIEGPSQFAHTVSEITTIKDLRVVAQNIRGKSNGDIIQVDVDCNWLLNHLKSVKNVVDALSILALNGFIPTPICDGYVRYHSKRATTEHRAHEEKSRIRSISTRCELTKITQQIAEGKDDILATDKMVNLHEKQNDLERKVKRLENASVNIVPKTFVSDLKAEIESRNESMCQSNITEGYIGSIIVAKFQADSVIAKRAVDGKSDIILGNDSDFLAYIGPSCIQIRKLKMRRQRGNNQHLLKYADLHSMEIACSSEQIINRIVKILVDSDRYISKKKSNGATDKNNIDRKKHDTDDKTNAEKASEKVHLKVKIAPYPIFQETNPMLRAASAVILGSDTFRAGIAGVGAATVYKKLQDLQDNDAPDGEKVQSFKHWACSGPVKKSIKMDEDVFDTFLAAFIFEPALIYNEDSSEIVVSEANPYIHGVSPLSLPTYLEEFAVAHQNQSIPVVDGPNICTCIGPYGKDSEVGSHLFIQQEEFDGVVKNCCMCNSVVCYACRVDHKVEGSNQLLCIQCYSTTLLLGSTSHDIKRIDEMKREIKDAGYELDSGASVIEIEELHDEYIEKKAICTAEDGEKNVIFPIFPAKLIDDYKTANVSVNGNINTDNNNDVKENGKSIKKIIMENVPFSDGGSFIADPSLSSKDIIISLMELLAAFVTHSDKHRYTKFDHKVYSILPTVIVEFANGSRHHSGFRLLQRCVRHVMDSRCQEIMNTNFTLVLCNDDSVGIHLKNKIPASMKQDVYDTELIMTKNTLLSCKCSCKCGAEKNEAVTCVHVLPPIFQVYILLLSGFVQNVLDEHPLPFTNVTDKGYRLRLASWRCGRQRTLQPAFAESDKKFSRKQTLSSATIASERSSNERSVRIIKTSKYIKRGLSQRQLFHRMQNIWLGYGFQANFLYLPVC